MKAGRHILAEGSLEIRTRRIVKEYSRGADFNTEILKALEKLRRNISSKRIEEYTRGIEEGNYIDVARDLMLRYYDPMYENEQKKFDYELRVNTDNMEEACSSIEKWLKNTRPE
jgi:tRNA 2-selenouridine synthase